MNTDKESLIVEAYKKGTKVSEICKEFHCSTNTLSKIIDKYNIPKRAKPQKVNKDLSKFYDLELPETQYWIGFICADGNINYSKDSRVYRVSLFSKDEEVVEKYRKYFGDIVSIYKRPSGIYEATINSKELCTYFINKLNITPNKSLTLDPNIEFTANFLLGYFDGDGCIINSRENRIRYECKITSGSIVFINKVKAILDSNGIYSIIREKGNAFDISIERKSESKKFYRYIYKDMVTCLSRKLNNFTALYGNI